MSSSRPPIPAVVLFDFGGVLAEEGFAAGLRAIALSQGLDPEEFFHQVERIIYDCGYVTGRNSEAGFWALVRRECGISGSDEELTGEIQRRFILRPGMLAKVRALHARSIRTGILSDQTDWLEQLDQRDHFLAAFDPVLNSYHLRRSKREPETFRQVTRLLGVEPGRILFVDDNAGHIGRAFALGLQVHHFIDENGFAAELQQRGLTDTGSEE
ncbi:MAG TPA: HAD family phosphatase [Desulfurivibrionaceae bacterium]|nr:HAD family phosphatase [Desulfurivibrionaceae bacterium]